jgi:F-type H+-transporting ATPase subunit b
MSVETSVEYMEYAEHTAPLLGMWADNPKYWVAIGFVLFAAVFIKYVLPLIVKGLDARSNAIREQLEQAQTIRMEAEELLEASKAHQLSMEREAEALIRDTELQVARMLEDAEAEVKRTLARRRQQAKDTIASMEAEARRELSAHMVDIATANARALMIAELQTMKDDPAIARVIQQIQQQVH